MRTLSETGSLPSTRQKNTTYNPHPKKTIHFFLQTILPFKTDFTKILGIAFILDLRKDLRDPQVLTTGLAHYAFRTVVKPKQHVNRTIRMASIVDTVPKCVEIFHPILVFIFVYSMYEY
jgi:hypothetical protein